MHLKESTGVAHDQLAAGVTTRVRDAVNSRPGIPDRLLAELPTPCLVVDLAAADRNIATMALFFKERPSVRLRPHFKAHKCTRLMRRQLDGGGTCGVTCATAPEALVLAREGFKDILLANELADDWNLDVLAQAARIANLTVAVDNPAHLAVLEQTALRGGVHLRVLVDIDPGMHRTGLNPDDPVVIELARKLERSSRLQFAGIFAYEGHVQLEPDAAIRRRLVSDAASTTRRARDFLVAAGFTSAIVSGGGTGTYDLSSDAGVLNEIQAGSYVLMDATYERLHLPFETALYCLTTVISTPTSATAAVNGGLKAMSFEKGPPRAVDPGIQVLKLSDEHGHLAIAEGTQVRVGQRLLLVPSHIDPTINLHPFLYAWDGVRFEEWAVDGRRAGG